jgi:hypothetical protein
MNTDRTDLKSEGKYISFSDPFYPCSSVAGELGSVAGEFADEHFQL